MSPTKNLKDASQGVARDELDPSDKARCTVTQPYCGGSELQYEVVIAKIQLQVLLSLVTEICNGRKEDEPKIVMISHVIKSITLCTNYIFNSIEEIQSVAAQA